MIKILIAWGLMFGMNLGWNEPSDELMNIAQIQLIEEQTPELFHALQIEQSDYELKEETYTVEISKVRLTNYYVNDSGRSGQCTSSGLCVKDFAINQNGWYTYNGLVVLGAATYRCLNASSGACGKYNTIPKGFNIHDIYEEVVLNIDGKQYEAIILDSCGACMHKINGEQIQRYDIFTLNPKNKNFVKPPRYAQLFQVIPLPNQEQTTK